MMATSSVKLCEWVYPSCHGRGCLRFRANENSAGIHVQLKYSFLSRASIYLQECRGGLWSVYVAVPPPLYSLCTLSWLIALLVLVRGQSLLDLVSIEPGFDGVPYWPVRPCYTAIMQYVFVQARRRLSLLRKALRSWHVTAQRNTTLKYTLCVIRRHPKHIGLESAFRTFIAGS